MYMYMYIIKQHVHFNRVGIWLKLEGTNFTNEALANCDCQCSPHTNMHMVHTPVLGHLTCAHTVLVAVMCTHIPTCTCTEVSNYLYKPGDLEYNIMIFIRQGRGGPAFGAPHSHINSVHLLNAEMTIADLLTIHSVLWTMELASRNSYHVTLLSFIEHTYVCMHTWPHVCVTVRANDSLFMAKYVIFLCNC